VLEDQLTQISVDRVLLEGEIKEATSNNDKITKYENYAKNLKTLSDRYNDTLPATLLTKEGLQDKLDAIYKELKDLKVQNTNSRNLRDAAVLNNNLVGATESRLKDNTDKLKIESTKLMETSVLCARLETLVSSMGSKGLVAYKIEALVKVFEELINEYLQVLSDGEFTLKFIMDDTKLQIRLTSGSVEMDVKSISSGEFNKVNTATLLAVRKMLTAISKIDINLLFLDEVVAVLDAESKDTLIDLLLKETNLNTIVVSHGYTHPLAARLNVIKENKISRLQLDE
jgi:DNA repair exonuclease SbcCD ATPase subunit